MALRVIVFNNNGVYKGTDFNPRGDDMAPPNQWSRMRYAKLMEAFGGVGVDASTTDELDNVLKAAVASGKPTLINAVIDSTAGSGSGRIGKLKPQSAAKKDLISIHQGEMT
jgi:oxalyl-CoA decarboxylase